MMNVEKKEPEKKTMPNTAYKIADKLFLIHHTLSGAPKTPAPPGNANHLAIFDVSGSMYGELPKVRAQMKNKLASLLSPGDTFSAIWFSGKKEFGVLLEAVDVRDVKSVDTIQKSIDKWLQPRGLTGFKEPLEEASELVERVSKKNKHPFSLFFQSDGHDNQWSKAEILKAVETAGKKVSAATFVEYGYYADRQLLAAMADKIGGAHIFAEDFDAYDPVFERVMKRKVPSAPKKTVKLDKGADPIGGFAFAAHEGDLLTFEAAAGEANVPEDLSDLFYLSSSLPKGVKEEKKVSGEAETGAYAALALFGVRMKGDVVFPLLKATGDVRFITAFTNCFGKQKYSAFEADVRGAVFDRGQRLIAGHDPNLVPREDAFTILDLLETLASDTRNRILMGDKEFKYSRIGRKEEANEGSLEFTSDFAPAGYSVDRLVFNESRPNISIGVEKSGTVKLPKKDRPKDVPEDFPTSAQRNYAIVRDGLVNVDKLPCLVTKATLETFTKEKVFDASSAPASSQNIDGVEVYRVVVDLKPLPVINRQMVKSLRAKDYFLIQWNLECARADQKVWNAYYKEYVSEKQGFTTTSAGFAEKYGADGAAWLKNLGLTDQGYSPLSTTAAKTGDFYTSKELHCLLKGLSSLPSLKEAKEKLAKATAAKPAPIGARLMAPAIQEAEAFLKSVTYTKAGSDEKKLDAAKAFFGGRMEGARGTCRDLLRQVARASMITVVGQVWFSDFASLDETEMTIEVDVPGASKHSLLCKVEMKEKRVDL